MTMKRETRQPKWLLIACILNCDLLNCCRATTSFDNKTGDTENKNGPRVFSPRMDYDEWTPLGRGDPLKNDPTFDYVPPILDRVQYWMDSHTTESTSSKSDILVLGVTAKKTSPKIPDQYIKYAGPFNGQKFMRNQDIQSGYTIDFTGSRGAEPPSIVRKTNFRNVPKDYRNQERIEAIPSSYYPSSFYNDNTKPETYMLPPPPIIRNSERPHQNNKNHLYSDKYRFGTQTEAGPVHQMKYQTYDHLQNSYSQQQNPSRINYNPVTYDRQKVTTKETSTSDIENVNNNESTTVSISSEKSNLIYQSSSHTINSGWLAKTRNPTQQSATISSNNYPYDEDVHQASGSSHHQVVLGPNANIIVEPETTEDEIVIGHKDSSYEIIDEETDDDEPEIVTAPEISVTENMYIVMANSSQYSDTNEETVTVVMPETIDDSSSTEKYNKTSTEIHKGSELKDSVKNPKILTLSAQRISAMPYRHQESMSQRPIGELQASQQSAFYHQPSRPVQLMMHNNNPHRVTISTITNRPLTNYPSNSDHMKPNIKFPSTISQTSMTNLKPSSQYNDKNEGHQTIGNPSPINAIRDLLLKHDSQKNPEIIETTLSTDLSNVDVTTTTIREIPTTISPTLTTDPIFSHYKQPANPMSGPMYLIIQGHSKVKTYKPWIDKRANEIDTNNEITTKKFISDFENFVKDNTHKIAVANEKIKDKTTERPKEQSSLLSFIDSGLGSFLSSSDSE